MAELMPADPRPKTNPWLKYLVFSFIALSILLVCLAIGSVFFLASLVTPIFTPWFEGVPQISGTVVDAMTGQSVPGMEVCLTATSKGIGGFTFDRSDVTHSDSSGKFSYASSTQKGFGFGGYEIGISDPGARLSPSCGKFRDQLTNSAFILGQFSPGDDNIRERFYFPVVIVEGRADDPNDQTRYGPMFQKFTDPRNIRIALIPLLKDESQCELIRDRTNAEFCRWMNSTGEAVLLRTRRRQSSSK